MTASGDDLARSTSEPDLRNSEGSERLADEPTGDHRSSSRLALHYQAAVQMAVYDGQLSWQVTGIFLQLAAVMVAGAVFPSFIGTTSKVAQALSGILISLAGVVVSAMFGSMAMRIRTYEEFWSAQAKHLEGQMLGLGTFTGASVLSAEGRVVLGGSTIRMRAIYAVKTKLMMGTFFGLFVATFVGLLVLNMVRMVEG